MSLQALQWVPHSLCLKTSSSLKATFKQVCSWFSESFFAFCWKGWNLSKESYYNTTWLCIYRHNMCACMCCVRICCPHHPGMEQRHFVWWHCSPDIASSLPNVSVTVVSHILFQQLDLSWVYLLFTNFICGQCPGHRFAFQVENGKYSSTVFYCSAKQMGRCYKILHTTQMDSSTALWKSGNFYSCQTWFYFSVV